MGVMKFFGFEAKLDEALSEARGEKKFDPNEGKIREIERKLETAKLTNAELIMLQKELKRLKSGAR